MSGVITQFSSGFNEVGITDTGNIRAQRQISDIASRGTGHIDVGGITRGAATLATNIVNAEKASEANNAKGDWVKVSTSEGYLDADAVGKAEMLEGIYSSLPDRSEAYQNSFMGYSSGEYARQYNARGVIEDNAHYNAAGASQMAWMQEDSGEEYGGFGVDDSFTLTNEQSGKTPQDFVDVYTTANPRLDKVVVSRALMSEAYVEMISAVNTAAPTEEALANAIADVEDIKAPYKTPQFLTTRQKQGQEYVNSMEASLTASIKAKQKDIKDTHFSFRAKTAVNGNRTHPDFMLKSIKATTANDVAYVKEVEAYTKKYNERGEADAYNHNNQIGSRTQALPKENKTLMKERQAAVTKDLTLALSNGDYENFARISYNERDFGKKTGEYLLNKINQATDPKELQSLMGFLGNVNATNQGPTALRQMLTDDEYTRVSVLHSMSLANSDKTLPELRDAIDKSKASTNIMKLDVGTEMEIREYAMKLGRQGNNFLNVMTQYKQINPQLAKEEYQNVAEYFASTIDTVDGVTIDSSMSQHPQALNQETFNAAISSEVVKDGDNVVHMTNSKGEPLMVVSDKLGTTTITNVQPYIDKNKVVTEYEAQRVEDRTILGDHASAIGSFFRVLVDNSVDTAVGTPGVIGDLVGNMTSRLGNHMIDSMTPGQAEFFGLDQKEARDDKEATLQKITSNEEFRESVYKALDEVEAKYINLEPDVSINTQSKYDQMSMMNALGLAQDKGRAAKGASNNMMVEDMVKSFETQEGSGDTLTDTPTGDLGVTENIKKRYGEDKSDKEVATMYLTDLSNMIDNNNSNIPRNLKVALLDTVYNTGEGALGWSSIKEFMNNPTEGTLQTAILTKIYAGGKSVKGIGKRRAEAYNKSKPSRPIKSVEQKSNGDMVYKDAQGKIIFMAKSSKERHSQSRAGTINL